MDQIKENKSLLLGVTDVESNRNNWNQQKETCGVVIGRRAEDWMVIGRCVTNEEEWAGRVTNGDVLRRISDRSVPIDDEGRL